MITLEQVIDAYMDCRRHKRSTVNQIDFERNLISNCVELWEDINNGTYYPGKSIAFIVKEPKPREIFAATFRDRIVHHIIMNRLESLFEKEFIDSSFNCRKKKGILYGVKQLHEDIRKCSNDYTENCYVVKFDLQGFFLSINKQILWNKVEKFIQEQYNGDDKEDILRLSRIVIMHCPEKNCIRRSRLEDWNLIPKSKSLFCVGDNFGLPIGNLTSQIFANFYLNSFDHFVVSNFQYYGRYVDDFYIITKHKVRVLNFVPKIRKFLIEDIGVTLHPKKFYMQQYYKGCDFIGYTVIGNRIYIGNRTLRHCVNRIHQFNECIYKSKSFSFICSLNSFLGFMKHARTNNIKLKTFQSINFKWFNYIYEQNNIFYDNTISNYKDIIKCKKAFLNLVI